MKRNVKESNVAPIPEMKSDENDPCYDCHYASWYELYGQMVHCCDLSICYKALEEEKLW